MKNYLFIVFALLFFRTTYSQTNSWVKASLPIHGTDYFTDISFSDDNNGLAIGIDFTEYNPRYITTDGGNTWNRQSWTRRGNACIHFNENGNAITARINLVTNNIVSTADDFAASWKNVSAPIINSQFGTKSCWIISPDQYFVAGAGGWGTDDGVYRKKNGLWEHVLKNIDATKIYFVDNQIGFVGTEYGDLYRTLDSGDTWENINYPANNQIDEINAIDKDIIYMGEYKTIDGGLNWSTVTFTSFLKSYYFFNESQAYGVTGSTDVYATNDGGLNWTKISKNKLTDNSNEIACCKKFIFLNNKIFALSDSHPRIYLMNIDASLATNKFSKNINIKIYPNPTNDNLNIKSESEISSLAIYDFNGRLIKTADFIKNNTYSHQLNVTGLSKGLYVLKIKSQQSIKTINFLKN